MPNSLLTSATRAFVTVLLSVAAAYDVAIQVNRESDAKALAKAYRSVVKKAHPDKGGSKKHFQKLQAGKEAFDAAVEQSVGKSGGPYAGSFDIAVVGSQVSGKGLRVRGSAVLLTYCGKWSLAIWRKFVTWVRKQLVPWSVWRWCATLEKSSAGKLHVHLALQFRRAVDRTVGYFSWEDRRPNASSNDYLGQGFSRNPRFAQQSIDRGFFYVFAGRCLQIVRVVKPSRGMGDERGS